jgi:hypothetical protein
VIGSISIERNLIAAAVIELVERASGERSVRYRSAAPPGLPGKTRDIRVPPE